LRVDQPEGVDDDLAFDGLDRVDDDGDGARVELLKGLRGVSQEHGVNWMCSRGRQTVREVRRQATHLLRVAVNRRQPAAEAGMRVVPADDHLWPASLFEHVEHLGLEDVVDRLDRD
jgi:hypothetical protein